MSGDRPTATECAIVSGTAFSCACATFALSAVLLIPVCGAVLQSIAAPPLIQHVVVLFLLFVLPIIGAFKGIGIGARLVSRRFEGHAAVK